VSDLRWMERCLELARQAEGRTAPNPMVGAVVVRDGAVVGQGWHARAGTPHAEVVALAQAGEAARGASIYVNLEPCCHHGRTPPCTEAIIRAGITRVVVGMVDPNPRVHGCGVGRLREAGVEVVLGVGMEACRELNRAFVTAMERGRPYVVLKAAASLDGRIATPTGESQWITSSAARAHGHGLRDRCDAILVGSGTALADDPRLSCRLEGGRDPVPVLLDARLRVPERARMFAAGSRALVYSCQQAPVSHPATVIAVPPGARGGVLLDDVLAHLVRRGVHSVLVEGGGQVHRAFLEAGVFDRVLLYLAPRVLAGGPGWVAGPGISSLTESFDLELVQVTQLGPDVLLELRRRDS
jgi:diaminohydroxyphosphoribosylaminopyrimidine deaminase/5-amino-6-(5-phosphoribosylamino)uracil reductase